MPGTPNNPRIKNSSRFLHIYGAFVLDRPAYAPYRLTAHLLAFKATGNHYPLTIGRTIQFMKIHLVAETSFAIIMHVSVAIPN